MALALNNLKRVGMPLNKETKPSTYIYIEREREEIRLTYFTIGIAIVFN